MSNMKPGLGEKKKEDTESVITCLLLSPCGDSIERTNATADARLQGSRGTWRKTKKGAETEQGLRMKNREAAVARWLLLFILLCKIQLPRATVWAKFQIMDERSSSDYLKEEKGRRNDPKVPGSCARAPKRLFLLLH
ncbi:hypothetical protein H6P81_015743 [Aristolochia fimbriata]|uniref:Uncharacterized protein n=1 Tax=Aristolochia fimbriata TaxID=158543 RepID=A0AAV7E6W3_ARIFI|nr:hypothetical protein H6P81_015743 [Aristolochia fimbriata]